MKKWKMRFTPEVSRLVAKLHPENKKLLTQAFIGLRRNPYTGKDLQEKLSGFKSLRLKRYRVIYTYYKVQFDSTRDSCIRISIRVKLPEFS